MRSEVFGVTARGLAIPSFEWGPPSSPVPKILILGGVHGNEGEGVIAGFGLLNAFNESFSYRLQVTLIPAFNLDGVLMQTRHNSRGVDLNRNLPTRDWNPKAFDPKYPPGPFPNSEPENQALVKFLEERQPSLIFSLHSWKPLVNMNGDCMEEARTLSRITGYEIKDAIGYATPGCLGTYAGLERSMPTITYEIERGLAAEKILSIHVPAILETLRTAERTRR